MILIGITGGIACGKTEVSKVFQKKGAIVFSGDQIGKEVVEKNKNVLKKLITTFGKEILTKNQNLNRRRLGKLAFSSKESQEKLNRIVHPHLLRELRERVDHWRKKKPKSVVVIDAALIVEWGLLDEVDCLILVESKREDKIKRLQQKKGYSRKEAQDRIKSQLPEIVKKRLADFVIKNDKDLEKLRKKADVVWKKIMMCRSKTGSVP